MNSYLDFLIERYYWKYISLYNHLKTGNYSLNSKINHTLSNRNGIHKIILFNDEENEIEVDIRSLSNICFDGKIDKRCDKCFNPVGCLYCRYHSHFLSERRHNAIREKSESQNFTNEDVKWIKRLVFRKN